MFQHLLRLYSFHYASIASFVGTLLADTVPLPREKNGWWSGGGVYLMDDGLICRTNHTSNTYREVAREFSFMALIRLLHRKPDGEIVFREPTGGDVPSYTILSHTWGKEEVSFQDMEAGTARSKAGWRKIEFCAKQATADGLQYFWIDTCCIDKKNAVELSAAINSMFRWYQKAVRCYVYLSDVSIHGEGQDGQSSSTWEAAFRKSRWFTRGWTLQELIAPAQVDFFSSGGNRLGNKLSLEQMVYDITGINRNALSGDPLPTFTIPERMSWAERRQTTIEEDEIYSLLGIFNVSLPLIYGEGRENASRRLREEIDKVNKGANFERFSIGLNLSTLPHHVQFVARSKELTEMHRMLHGHSTRSIVILHGLGGIGKTQLSLAYAMRHEEKFSAIFWLNANDEGSLKLSFRAIAQQILKYHPSTSLLASIDLDDLDQVGHAVKAWLDLQKNT
ncbi:HET-domain-containing protein, partial [Patellaria atrata CBS 101060]